MRKVYIFVGIGGEGKTWLAEKARLTRSAEDVTPEHLDNGLAKLLSDTKDAKFELVIETSHLTSRDKSRYFKVCKKHETELVVVSFKRIKY